MCDVIGLGDFGLPTISAGLAIGHIGYLDRTGPTSRGVQSSPAYNNLASPEKTKEANSEHRVLAIFGSTFHSPIPLKK